MFKCYCYRDIVRLRGLFVLCVMLFSLCLAYAEDFDWKIRVLIVTGATPRDGHLRFFRSLGSADVPVEIVQTSDEKDEISKVLQTIRNYNQDEVLILTNSDQYLATQEAPVAAWTVTGEAARQEASVLLPLPAVPRVMSYEVQEQLQRVQKELEAYREFERSGVKPHGPHGLENARKLLKELQHLRVREEQDQRLAKADTKSFKAFAFAGLTSSVQNLLERLDARLHEGSLGAAWRVLAESPGLRKRLEVALDHRYVAFRRADTLQTGNFGYRARLNGEPIVHAKDLTLPPFLYGTPLDLPASLANLVAREVVFKLPCPDCPDEPLERPRVLGEGQQLPSVKVAVFVEDRVPFFRLFLRRLGRLHYPKDRIALFIYISEAASQHVQEFEDFVDKYEMQYQDVGVAYPDMGFDYKKAHRLLWLEASKSNEDYLFMLDANVQLTNPDILQDLMRKRRNVVGPLLTHAGGSGHNLMTDYINHEFSEGFLAGDFVARRREENGTIDVGMLQVARIKSALLLTRDAFLHIKMKSFTSSGDDMWNRFFIHVFEQGYLPYACNQENYGHLTKADDEGKFTPDVWNLERNQEDFIAYFTFLQTPEGQEVALGEGECEGVARRWFFREPFARDLMARVEGGSGWEEAARKGASATAEVLAPPEGLERKAGQALAKFVVRNMMPQLDDTQVSSAGDLYVLKGSGSFSPEEASFVVLIALGDKVTKVEIQSKGERRCHLGLQKGEAASFRSADFPKLTFPQSVTLALMAL